MNVLSGAAQKQVEDELVETGILQAEILTELRKKADVEKIPLFSLLVREGNVSNEQLTKVIAHTNKVPYVNLSAAKVEPKVLELLPQDIAERYMAVPLGEIQHRLVIAMLDA